MKTRPLNSRTLTNRFRSNSHVGSLSSVRRLEEAADADDDDSVFAFFTGFLCKVQTTIINFKLVKAQREIRDFAIIEL
jgi:hypothetical protein